MQAIRQLPLQGVMMAVKEVLDKFEAGQLLRQRREALRLTQEEVVNNTTIPVTTYLSELENGKVNVGRSKHFPSLATYLRLSEEDIRAINPSAVIELARPTSAPFDPFTLFHPRARQERIKRPLWLNLAAMIEEKSEKYDRLRQVGWQQHLNQTRFSGGQEPDADGWFEMFRALERAGVDPEPWPEE